MAKYLYLKLGKGNCLAEYWLSENNIVKRPTAAIYFGTIRAEKIGKLIKLCEEGKEQEAKEEFTRELKRNGGKGIKPDFNAVKNFFEAKDNIDDRIFITIANGRIYFLKPTNRILDLEKSKYEKYDRDLKKLIDKTNTAKPKNNIEEGKIFNDESKYLDLFSINSRFESELNNGAISDDLKNEFEKNGFSAPDQVKKKDGGWEVNGKIEFIIEKKDGELKVCAKIKNIPKIMPVEILNGNIEIADVPHVLASLPCNQYYTQRTCREIKEEKYLFNWDEILEDKSQELRKYPTLRKFLMVYVDGDWKKATISKTDRDFFKVSEDKKSVEFRLNKKRDRVTLKVDDNRTYDFVVKEEEGKLNVFKKEDWGAIQAIKHCLNNEQLDKPKNASELMSFLSPYELETLVFLILKNAGLFVPAWRGGTQKGIDIIAKNLTPSSIEIFPIIFKSKSSFTFQVKRRVKERSKEANYTVATEYYGTDERVLNAEWLLRQIQNKNQSETKNWFTHSLNWIKDVDGLIDQLNC